MIKCWLLVGNYQENLPRFWKPGFSITWIRECINKYKHINVRPDQQLVIWSKLAECIPLIENICDSWALLNEIISYFSISDLQTYKLSCASPYFFLCLFIVKLHRQMHKNEGKINHLQTQKLIYYSLVDFLQVTFIYMFI